MNEKLKIALIAVGGVLLTVIGGCNGATGNMNASDPTERGLSYVAAAIVTSGVLRAIFNK